MCAGCILHDAHHTIQSSSCEIDISEAAGTMDIPMYTPYGISHRARSAKEYDLDSEL